MFDLLLISEKDVYVIYDRFGSDVFRTTDSNNAIRTLMSMVDYPRTRDIYVYIQGDYEVDNSAYPLTIPSNTHVYLNGTIRAKSYDKTLVYLYQKRDVSLIGGVYDGGATAYVNDDIDYNVIKVESCQGVSIYGVEVRRGYGRGLQIANSDRVIIDSVYVHDNWRNLMVYSSDPLIPRKVVVRNVFTEKAGGGCGIDLGTAAGVVIENVLSSEDNPAPVCIDSCNWVTVKNVISKFRGVAIVYAGYSNSKGIVIDTGYSLGAYGAILVDGNYYTVESIVLRNIYAEDCYLPIEVKGNVGYVEVNAYTRRTKGDYSIVNTSTACVNIVHSSLDKPVSGSVC